MSTHRLEIVKYYRLADKTSIETENLAVLVDTRNRRLAVTCQQVQKENVAIVSDPSDYPKLMFREIHLYVMLSDSSSDGFRLTFGRREREVFLKIMHSMGVLMDVPAEFPRGNSQISVESQGSQGIRGSGGGRVKMEIQGTPQHHQAYDRPPSSLSSCSSSISHRYPNRPPAFTQQPTPQVAYPPNIRRDTTYIINHQNGSYSQPIDSSSPWHHPYHGIAYETTGGRSSTSSRNFSQKSFHEYGESVVAVKNRKEEPQKLDKAIQTDDLIDVLLDDEEFTKKALETFMCGDKFADVVKSMRSRLENMDTVEQQRLHWKTNPNFNSQCMPPPVIHLPNSDAE